MKEIENRKDIENLIQHFYGHVQSDPKMAPNFVMVKERWNIHMGGTYVFWDNCLFYTGDYKRGLFCAHIEKNQTQPISTNLFERWLTHCSKSVNIFFIGDKAEFLKSKALELGQMINVRLSKV
jgi:hemoglobin